MTYVCLIYIPFYMCSNVCNIIVAESPSHYSDHRMSSQLFLAASPQRLHIPSCSGPLLRIGALQMGRANVQKGPCGAALDLRCKQPLVGLNQSVTVHHVT